MKKAAVVILNWNGVALLQKFLSDVILHSPEATVYIADNASTDNSVTVLQKDFPQVKIIQNKENFGFAKGYNEVLKQVEEDIYILLNSDVEVTQNWIAPILNIFENQPETAIVQPKILDYKNKDFFEYAGAAGGFIDKYGFPFCRGRIFDTIEKDFGQYDENGKIFWASGACFFIRKDVFRELSGFDDDFFAHQEEIDLCWRAFNKGYKCYYCADSVVYHIGGATLKTGSSKKTFLNFRNSLFMLLKNLPKKHLFSTIFIRLCLDGLAGIRFITQGKISLCFAIIKAHFAFYGNLKKCYKKRNKQSNGDYFLIKNIVYQYYIKKKKTYVLITKKGAV